LDISPSEAGELGVTIFVDDSHALETVPSVLNGDNAKECLNSEDNEYALDPTTATGGF